MESDAVAYARIAEIERLRAELAAAIKHRDGYLALLDKSLSVIVDANENAAQYKQQRDEARRWVCELLATPTRATGLAKPGKGTAECFAKEQGWECFAKKEGGGA